jgi:hypothetical protein
LTSHCHDVHVDRGVGDPNKVSHTYGWD